jgi:hypothetical protein
LADQRVTVARLTENGDIGMAGATGEVARELVADALHQSDLDAHPLSLAVGLAGVKRSLALRLHALQHLTHVGEARVDSIQRQERRGGKADADEMRPMVLGERRGELDARLCRST